MPVQMIIVEKSRTLKVTYTHTPIGGRGQS
jgi:hypothetical protein